MSAYVTVDTKHSTLFGTVVSAVMPAGMTANAQPSVSQPAN